MKLTSESNRRLLKSITGGVLVSVLCISGPFASSGHPGPPLGGGGPPLRGGGPPMGGGPHLGGGGPKLPGSLARGRMGGVRQAAFCWARAGLGLRRALYSSGSDLQ